MPPVSPEPAGTLDIQSITEPLRALACTRVLSKDVTLSDYATATAISLPVTCFI